MKYNRGQKIFVDYSVFLFFIFTSLHKWQQRLRGEKHQKFGGKTSSESNCQLNTITHCPREGTLLLCDTSSSKSHPPHPRQPPLSLTPFRRICNKWEWECGKGGWDPAHTHPPVNRAPPPTLPPSTLNTEPFNLHDQIRGSAEPGGRVWDASVCLYSPTDYTSSSSSFCIPLINLTFGPTPAASSGGCTHIICSIKAPLTNVNTLA